MVKDVNSETIEDWEIAYLSEFEAKVTKGRYILAKTELFL